MIYLYTPLPPTFSGTADYAAHLLDDFGRVGREIRARIVVVIDSVREPKSLEWGKAAGWQVKDFREIFAESSDVSVFFLASNEFHHYVYDQLALCTRGLRFSVIHDLSAGAVINYLRHLTGSPYAYLAWQAFAGSVGVLAAATLRDHDKIAPFAWHQLLGQGATTALSDIIFTHSYYAKSRLILENAASNPIAPDRIVVCGLPSVKTPMQMGSAKRIQHSVFLVATLGHYSLTKRAEAVVAAWRRFVLRIAPSNARLLVGGNVSPSEQLRLREIAGSEMSNSIEFSGHVSDNMLSRILDQCALLVNLRFPTVGETSAMAARAFRVGCPVATTALASFLEEPAAARISPDPLYETTELSDAIEQAYSVWRQGDRLENRPPAFGYPKRNLVEAIVREVARAKQDRPMSRKQEGMMNDAFAQSVRYVTAVTSRHEPCQMLAIGGVARSGTSSCERYLHRSDKFFIADEFHGLYDPKYISGMRFLSEYAENELSIWTDDRGKTWKGFDKNDLELNRRRVFFMTLLMYTRTEKFKNKNPDDVQVFGFKLPYLEVSFAGILPLISDKPIPFIYCVRSPAEILVSRWSMPWTAEHNPTQFIDSLTAEIESSMAGLDRVIASGCPVATWYTPMHETDIIRLLEELGLGAFAPANLNTGTLPRVDEWPGPTRRQIAELSKEDIDRFLGSSPVVAYVRRFRLPSTRSQNLPLHSKE